MKRSNALLTPYLAKKVLIALPDCTVAVKLRITLLCIRNEESHYTVVIFSVNLYVDIKMNERTENSKKKLLHVSETILGSNIEIII